MTPGAPMGIYPTRKKEKHMADAQGQAPQGNQSPPPMQHGDLGDEEYREYIWKWAGETHTHKIDNPKSVYYYKGCSTHRVVGGDGLVYVVPAPGVWGCVVRWKPKDPTKPVQF